MLPLLLKSTIWAALWLAVLSAWVRWSRWCWIGGGVCLAAHVALAFHGVHGWSHEAAVEATALQVEAVTGVRSGAGIWMNHLFLAAWVWVAWRWDRLGLPGRRIWWGVLLFMGVNGGVVFVEGAARWIGIGWGMAAGVSAGRSLGWIRGPAPRAEG
jgi:hypothetical protein